MDTSLRFAGNLRDRAQSPLGPLGPLGPLEGRCQPFVAFPKGDGLNLSRQPGLKNHEQNQEERIGKVSGWNRLQHIRIITTHRKFVESWCLVVVPSGMDTMMGEHLFNIVSPHNWVHP